MCSNLLAVSISSEISFGYLEMIKLNNAALYNFAKSSQEKTLFYSRSQRLDAMKKIPLRSIS